MIVTPELIEEWKKWFLATGHTMPSTQTYYSFIKKYVHVGVDITQKTVNDYRIDNMSCPGSGSLKSFFKFLVDKKGYPEKILLIRFDRNKPQSCFPHSVSVKEIQLIIDNIEVFRYKVLTKVVFELALRISEAIRLDWADFNWMEWLEKRGDTGKVSIKKAKRNSFRVMSVTDERMLELYNLCNNKTSKGIPINGLVFNLGIGIQGFLNDKMYTVEENIFRYISTSEGTYGDLLRKVSKACIGKQITPHQLRHSRAQMLMDNGMSIESLKTFLGHKSISTTEIYAQASPEKVRKELIKFDTEKLHPLQKPVVRDVNLIQREILDIKEELEPEEEEVVVVDEIKPIQFLLGNLNNLEDLKNVFNRSIAG